MRFQKSRFRFQGVGEHAELTGLIREIQPAGGVIGPWKRRANDEGVDDNRRYPDHPANYRASRELIAAVNTAIAIEKPLLLTGNPGTGKSQLAERIAWEFNLGPVLRFEAQSLSEANDLFYRFDLIGHMSAVQLYRSAVSDPSGSELSAHLREQYREIPPETFVKIGPLGEAILRSDPEKHQRLFDATLGRQGQSREPRASVVLIDEIDKASRDFPNDLLNGIERLEFTVRELVLEPCSVNDRFRPIVIITSNSERDLPPAFLRRCTFFHIPDPTRDELEKILAQKFFAGGAGKGADKLTLPPFFGDLLTKFMQFRELKEDDLQYKPGTAEIINWTDALIQSGVTHDASISDKTDLLEHTVATVSKHRDDQASLIEFIKGLKTATT